MDIHQNILRSIPSVNELLESPEISKLTDLYPRQLVVEAVREVLEEIRQSMTNKTNINEIAMSKEGKKRTESPPSFDERGQVGMVKDREFSDEEISRIADTYHAWRGEKEAGKYKICDFKLICGLVFQDGISKIFI